MSLHFGDFELDRERRQLLRAGTPVPLEPKAYELLCLLVDRRPRALSQAHIRDAVWPETFVSESTLRVVVNGIRQALGDDARKPRFVRTVRGFGYAFCGEAREEPGADGARTKRASDAPQAAAGGGELGGRRWLLPAAVAAVVALAVGAEMWLSAPGAPSAPTLTPHVRPLTRLPGWEATPALSPDGSRVAFSWEGEAGGNWDIYVAQIGTEARLRLTRHPGRDFSPAWSPDGLHVAFARQTETELAFFVVPALGGAERKLHAFPFAVGSFAGDLDWSPDGTALAFADVSTRPPREIALLSIETLEITAALPAPYASALAFSPDGRRLAYVGLGSDTSPEIDIYVVAVAGGAPRRLTFDNRWEGRPAWTRDGSEIVFSSDRSGESALWRVAASGGAPRPVVPGGGGARWISIARRADRLAYERPVVDTNIWRIGRDGSAEAASGPVPIVVTTAVESEPHLSPDGGRIAFVSDRSGHPEIWSCRVDGSGCSQLSSMEASVCGAPRWSPDGREIAFDCRPGGSQDVYVVDPETRAARRLTSSPSEDGQASWSQDGRWVYFGSDRSGSWQVWKTPAAGGRAVQVTTGGGWRSRESPDGASLYYARTFFGGDIWRRPVGGGEETPVLEVPGGFWWEVAEAGVYYVDARAGPDPVVEVFDPDSGRVARVGVLEGELTFDAGLTVSADGRSILYTRLETAEQDLMLIEGFR